jgi:putative lipoprotein
MLVRVVAIALALFGLTVSAMAQDVVFTGEVTYRERVAMPRNAELKISLVELERGVAVAGAQRKVGERGGVPLQFQLNVRSKVVKADKSYGLVAEIRSGGRIVFVNETPVAVDVADPQPSVIVVRHDPHPVRIDPTLEPMAANPLADTHWRVTSVGGEPVTARQLSFVVSPDLGIGGHGGCNRYFTEANFIGSTMTLGPIAGTKMACGGPAMALEQKFFNALAAVAGFKQSENSLQLLDGAGVPLVGLVRD